MVADAVAAGGGGFANKSQVMFGDVVRMLPLMASHIFMICALDWILSYHGPQLGPINVGMWYLLISIFSPKFLFCLKVFMSKRGLYQ